MKKNILLLFLVHGVNYLFPFIVLPYQTRILSIAAFADVAKIQAAIMLLSLIVNFGYNLSSTRDIARASTRKNVDEIYSETLYVKTGLATVCLLGGVLYLYLNNQLYNIIPFLVGSLYLFGCAFFATWLFQGLEKMKEVVIATSIAKLLGLFLTFVLVKESDDINSALFTQNIGMFASGLISIYIVKRRGYSSLVLRSISDFILSIRGSWPFFLSVAATSVYTYLNIILLSFFTSDIFVANFNAADKLRMAAQGLLLPIGQAVFPRLSRLNNDTYKENLKLYSRRFCMFGALLSLSMLLFGSIITKIYLGSGYNLAGDYVEAMFLLPLIISFSTVLGQWILIPTGKENKLSKIYITGAILHLLYALPLVYYNGVWGMIISILLTESIIVYLMYKAIK